MKLLGTKSHSPDVPSSIIAAQEAMVEVNRRTELNVALTTASRAQQMLTDMQMWRWLWKTTLQAGRSLAQPEGDSATTPPWIGRLAWFIRGKIHLRKGFEIESSTFLEGVAPSVSFTYTVKRGDTAYADFGVLHQRVAEVFEAALRKWLSFPSGDTAPYRAQFVFFVVQRFASPAVLYLPVTWSTRSRLRATLFDRATDLSKVNWTGLSFSLSRHPLADPTTSEASILQQIDAKQRELMELTTSVQLDFDLPVISDREHLLSQFLAFLKDAAVTERAPPVQLTQVQRMIVEESDRFQPFREHGLSRTIVRDHPQSPYSPARLRT